MEKLQAEEGWEGLIKKWAFIFLLGFTFNINHLEKSFMI